MNASPSRSPFRPILAAGGVCATIDIVYACSFHYLVSATPPLRILHTIASGLLGPAAFRSGAGGAALGLFAHYAILVIAAALYYAAARRLRLLWQRPWISGFAFGLGIWLTMNFFVLPLSAAPKFQSSLLSFCCNLAVHVLLLGPAIALMLRRAVRAAAHADGAPQSQY